MIQFLPPHIFRFGNVRHLAGERKCSPVLYSSCSSRVLHLARPYQFAMYAGQKRHGTIYSLLHAYPVDTHRY